MPKVSGAIDVSGETSRQTIPSLMHNQAALDALCLERVACWLYILCGVA